MISSDVYSKFLSGNGNIKVFPASVRDRGFEISKKVLRKTYPFLFASAVSFTSCGLRSDVNKSNSQDVSFDEIYTEVIDKYNLDKLKEKEPLPKVMIKEIMEAKSVPVLDDFNYNHLPENKDNFWSMVKNGVSISVNDVPKSNKLKGEQVKIYRIMAFKMLSQISRIKGTVDDVDLSDYNNLKAFSYFEKVVKYKDDYDRLKEEEGVIDGRFEVYGRYYKDYQEMYKKYSGYAQLMEFSENLYKCVDKDKMLPQKDSAYYNKESYKILNNWLVKQEIYDKGIFYHIPVDDDPYCNAVANYYKRGKDLNLILGVDPRGDLGEGFYSPVGDIIVHEILHVMQKKPSSAEEPSDNCYTGVGDCFDKCFKEHSGYLDELGPTLMSLSINDYLYKKKHNIGENEIVNYGSFSVRGKTVKLGELAVWFSKKLEECKENDNGRISIDKLLLEPKVFKELKAIASGYKVNNHMLNVNKDR